MFQWIAENAGTLVISAVIAGIVILTAVRLLRNRKQGKSSCGCSCGCCPMSGTCHGQAGGTQGGK